MEKNYFPYIYAILGCLYYTKLLVYYVMTVWEELSEEKWKDILKFLEADKEVIQQIRLQKVQYVFPFLNGMETVRNPRGAFCGNSHIAAILSENGCGDVGGFNHWETGEGITPAFMSCVALMEKINKFTKNSFIRKVWWKLRHPGYRKSFCIPYPWCGFGSNLLRALLRACWDMVIFLFQGIC